MANTYLTRTPSTTGNTKKFTISYWIKRTGLGTEQDIFHVWSGSGSRSQILFNSSNQLKLDLEGGNTNNLITNRLFRDTSAWYHIVIVYDSDNSTSSDRLKIYVNGVRETSFATAQYPSSGSTSQVNTTTQHEISSYDGAGYYFEGSMSHIHFTDGYVYDATAFGEYDANGVWKIKTSPSVTYGTNGFFILKDGNSVTDQSGQGNNWTVGGGTLTNTEDSPSNVFCTLNPLDASSSGTFSNGNNTYGVGSVTWCPAKSTLAFSNGKYYCEAKGVSGTNLYVGVYDVDVARGSVQSEMDNNRIVYVSNGSIQKTLTGNSEVTGLATYTTSDIIGCAVDKENGTVKFYKNGTLIHTETDSSVTNKTLCFGTQVNNSTLTYNFGNGYFGTTAVASAGTNASGNGIFEHDVPTGFTALSTKGLNL